MSMLPAEVHAALNQLLQALQSADNVARTQAEEQLTKEWVNTQPDVCLMGLVEQLHSGDNPTVSAEPHPSFAHRLRIPPDADKPETTSSMLSRTLEADNSAMFVM